LGCEEGVNQHPEIIGPIFKWHEAVVDDEEDDDDEEEGRS
jgi:hypothetical protein